MTGSTELRNKPPHLEEADTTQNSGRERARATNRVPTNLTKNVVLMDLGELERRFGKLE